MIRYKKLFPVLSLELICSLFGKTRQGWYKQQKQQEQLPFEESIILLMVDAIRKDMPRVGVRKLHLMLSNQLLDHGVKIGRDAMFSLLSTHGMLIRKRKSYTKTTLSMHRYRRHPNLIENLEVYRSEQIWVSDITYIRLTSGFSYLSLITDLYSHFIMGYYLSPNLGADGCLISLDMAIKNRSSHLPLIHHSDRGVQYCCDRYVEALSNESIKISMTQSGSPYDNAVAERVNGILKDEFDLCQTFSNYELANKKVDSAIEIYNYLRPHNSCSNLTPAKAHEANHPLKKVWKNYYKKKESQKMGHH